MRIIIEGKNIVREDGSIDSLSPYITWRPGDDRITIDCGLDIKDLKAIADYVNGFEWTTTLPTVPGAYFAILANVPMIVRVYIGLFIDELYAVQPGIETEFALSRFSHWLGPLPVPEPPEKW